jgi:hypothetical protein
MNKDQTTPATRTDDLLASGAESADGARGFGGKDRAAPLQTGMEGIKNATAGQGNWQSDSQGESGQKQTLPDNPGRLRNKQES